MSLQDCVVGLWSDSPSNPDSFEGSGVCITPEWIITSAHVARNLRDDLTSFADMTRNPKVLAIDEIQTYGKRDAALIKLVHPHGKKIVPMDCTTRLEEDWEVKLVAYNSAEGAISEFIVQLKNRTSLGGWEFHTMPAHGMSGGAVVYKNKLVGIIQARDDAQNSGIIVPLSKLKSFLVDYVATPIQGDGPNPASPRKYPELPEDDGDFQSMIADEIKYELGHPDTASLVTAMMDTLRIREREPNIPKIVTELLSLKIDDVIRNYLRPATNECIRKGGRHYQEDTVVRENILAISQKILGWLVLRSVDEEKVNMLLPESGSGGPLSFRLGHQGLGGVELVIARRFLRQSRFAAHKVQSPFCIQFDARNWSTGKDEVVQWLLLEIWNKLNRRPGSIKKDGEKLEPGEIDFLNEQLRDLRERHDETEHYYIAFRLLGEDTGFVREVYKLLLTYLTELTVVEYASESGGDLYILNESRMVAAIDGYYRDLNLNELQQSGKEQ